jgi:hypothetical protein
MRSPVDHEDSQRGGAERLRAGLHAENDAIHLLDRSASGIPIAERSGPH